MKKLYLYVMAMVYAVLPCRADAIITRHDLSDSDYVVSGEDYPALVSLLGPSDCTGTLIHKSFLLTVAHCAVELKVGQTLEIKEVAYRIEKVLRHPKWSDNRDEYDIALVKFEKPVQGVKPLPLYRGDQELGKKITLFGRGDHATGLQGEKGAVADGKLRRATNTVSRVSDQFIEIIFERPGEKDVTKLEGVGAAGDSGGPSFLYLKGVPYLAGLNSWGEGGKKIGVGQYGARDYQTRVSKFLKWIDDHMTP